MAEQRTSLERLQALDKDYSTFSSQLKALKNILDITSDLRNPRSYTSFPTDALPKRRAQGRASFALRWLLNKLQSLSEARLLPESWTTLRVIIAILSPHATNKLLLSSKFIDAVDKTLQDAFSSPETMDLAIKDEGIVAAPSGDVPASQLEKATSNRHERKRKRTEDINSADRAKRRRSPDGSAHHVTKAPSMTLLIDALGLCLEHVGDVTALDTFARSPLKTDTQTASKILGTWLSALRTNDLESESSQSNIDTLLDPILNIWESRASSLSQSDDSSLFCKHVLLPASRLLSLLYQASSHEHHQGQLKGNSAIVDIERLIARHVFLPARATFHESAALTSAISLETLLEPIKTLPSRTDTPVESVAHDFLHVLFSVAIRCSPRSSTRKMLSEQPWLEHVFAVLMGCVPTSRPTVHLQKLLSVAKRYEVKFNRETLRSLISDYGNLSSDDQVPQWRLVSDIIALDPQAVLPNASKEGNDGLQLDQLLAAVTHHSPVLHHPVTSPYSNQAEISSQEQDKLFGLITNDVVKPLMQAHARARDLKGFLHLWHRCLGESLAADNANGSDTRPPFSVKIWEQEGLTVALSDLLETSITSKTLLEMVTGFADDIAISELAPEGQRRCFASANMLKTLFRCCRSDEYISTLLPVAPQLVRNSLRMIYGATLTSSRLKQVLWKLAASSFCLWSSTSEHGDIEADPLLVSRTQVPVQNSDKSGSAEETLVTLASLLSMRKVVTTSRHIECKDIEDEITLCITSAMKQDTKTLEQEHVFASIVSAFPSLFELERLSKETRIKILNRIFFAATSNQVIASIWLSLVRRITRRPYQQDVLHVLDQPEIYQNGDPTDFSELKLITSAELESQTQHRVAEENEPKAKGQDLVTDAFLEGLDETQRTAYLSNIVQNLQLSMNVSNQGPKEWDTLYELLASACQPGRQHLGAASAAVIVGGAAECLPQATTWPIFKSITSILTLMLIHHGRLISQFEIESIISAVHLCSIAAANHEQVTQMREHAGRVYISLCRITQTLMALHRRKLVGRLDILVPILQSLLRCLFSVPAGGKLPPFAAEQASWLQGRSLGVKHAAHYTKLLTTLFDPTPSSVAPPKSKSRSNTSTNLIDYTLRARRTAGQYAPYILLSLCQLQLDGRFADDGMREVLMPGVCVTFDCMGLVDSGRGDDRDSRNRGRNGKRTGLVDVVHEDAGGVWGVSAAQRTVLRAWWVDWERRR